MVAYAEADNRDTHVVEIEFEDHVPTQTIVDFINSVNRGNVPLLAERGEEDDVRAAFVFQGAPQLADSLQPRRDRFIAVRVPSVRNSNEVAGQLKASNPNIMIAARRPMFVPASDPFLDPYVGQSDQQPAGSTITQWYIHRCKANQAWRYSLGKGVVVADIDWGFRLTHDDLAGRYDPMGLRNVLKDSKDVSIGDLAHGTGAAGMIGAGANAKGIAGFAPECTLWLLQAGIMRATGAEPAPGLVNPWATAIDWVVTEPSTMRKVVNIEVQTGMRYSAESSVAVQGAVRRAVAAEVFVCVPAGNGGISADVGEDGHQIPETGSIVIAATGYDSRVNPRALYSNFGNRVRLAAPGESKLDLTCGGASDSDYTAFYGGTSGASAKAAGALALVLSRNDKLKHKDLVKIIDALNDDVDSQEKIGKFLDCAALSAAAFQIQQQDEEASARKEKPA